MTMTLMTSLNDNDFDDKIDHSDLDFLHLDIPSICIHSIFVVHTVACSQYPLIAANDQDDFFGLPNFLL